MILSLCTLSMVFSCTPSVHKDGNPFILPFLDRNRVIGPNDAHNLSWFIETADPGSTLLLEDGIYQVDTALRFTAAGVTLRSISGRREAVIIDGEYYGYLIQIAAANITIADLTLKRAKFHLIHIVGSGHYATLNNLHLIDARQQFIKANPSQGMFCDFGTVKNCLFELTDEGRAEVDPQIGGCYTGGVDVLSAMNWNVSDNRFENIYCTNGGLPTHMVLFWKTSKDPVVERNVIVNCARGIGFGLGAAGGHREYDSTLNAKPLARAGHIGGSIRGNVIIGDIGNHFDTGIGLEQAYGVTVENNFIYSTGETFSSIDARFTYSNPVIRNNLVKPKITVRDGASPTLSSNTLLE